MVKGSLTQRHPSPTPLTPLQRADLGRPAQAFGANHSVCDLPGPGLYTDVPPWELGEQRAPPAYPTAVTSAPSMYLTATDPGSQVAYVNDDQIYDRALYGDRLSWKNDAPLTLHGSLTCPLWLCQIY